MSEPTDSEPVSRRFNPTKLKYDRDWIPVLSAHQIEEIASEVLECYCPQVLQKEFPRKTPVIEILSTLCDRTRLKFAHGDLGYIGESKVLGKVSFSTRTLSIDDSLMVQGMENRLQFTAAHEIGHWVLHRHSYQRWKFTINSGATLDDDESSLTRLSDFSPRDWLEYQANVFAAALVLPSATFEFAVAQAQWGIGIRRNVGLVYLNGSLSSELDRFRVLERLETVYGVSKQALQIRLEALGLVAAPAPKTIRSHEAIHDAVGGMEAFGF